MRCGGAMPQVVAKATPGRLEALRDIVRREHEAEARGDRREAIYLSGIITAVISFFIGALWLALISKIGIAGFVDTLGAVLAPLYGIVVADYYLVRKQRLNVQDLFSAEPGSTYYFDKGWNKRALVAFTVASVFSVASVWTPALAAWAGFSWMFGALLGAVLHLALMIRKAPIAVAQPT